MQYVPDYSGLGDLLLGPEMYAELTRRAELAADYARTNAPVGRPPDDPHPGAYKASIEVVKGTSFKGRRASASVVANVGYAMAVENRFHVLSAALDIAEKG